MSFKHRLILDLIGILHARESSGCRIMAFSCSQLIYESQANCTIGCAMMPIIMCIKKEFKVSRMKSTILLPIEKCYDSNLKLTLKNNFSIVQFRKSKFLSFKAGSQIIH